jgi:malonyl-CoA O-methyltransferase
MKSRIRQNFSRAVSTYAQFGKTQQKIAADFAEKLSHLPPPSSILEIGCGTGFLSRHLLQYPCPLILGDLSHAMLTSLSLPQGLPIVFDGECLPFKTQFDWIVSSLVVQWFDKPWETLPRLQKQSNTLAFTTLGDHSFQEWKDFCQRHGLEDRTRPFPSAANLKTTLGPTAQIQESYYSEHHPNWLNFWRGIHKIGAHGASPPLNPSIPSKKPLTKSLLQGGPVRCSYHVITVILQPLPPSQLPR